MKQKNQATTNSYSSQYKDPQWQKKRLEVMERDDFTCCKCSRLDSELNVHHFYYDKGSKVWEYPSRALVTLCRKCHEELHAEMEFFNLISISLYKNFVFGGITPQEVAEFISSCESSDCKVPFDVALLMSNTISNEKRNSYYEGLQVGMENNNDN